MPTGQSWSHVAREREDSPHAVDSDPLCPLCPFTALGCMPCTSVIQRLWAFHREREISECKTTLSDRHFSKEDIRVANKHMKRCLTSLVIWKMKLKTTTRCHFTPTRMAIIKTRENKCWRGRGETGALPHSRGDEMWGSCCGNVWRLLKKLDTECPCDPASPLLGTCPREMKIYVHTKTCPPIAAERQK